MSFIADKADLALRRLEAGFCRDEHAGSRIFTDEKKESAFVFPEAALAYYASLGITVRRVMTDNGKAERFIQTALREWAYARAYQTSDKRAEELPLWLHCYNWHRPHGSLKAQPPISRLGLTRNNLLRLHN